MLVNLLLAGFGGFCGAAARLAVVSFIDRHALILPYFGTLAVNGVGSFVAGLFLAIPFTFVGTSARILLLTGFLGGFTTFSAFSIETLTIFGLGNIFSALLNVLLNVAISLGLAACGYGIAKIIFANF